jgi:glycerol-3-phosphate acyltransferase PlsX
MKLKIGIDTEGLDRGFEVAIEGSKQYLNKNPSFQITLYVLESNFDRAKEITGSIPNLRLVTSKLGATTQVAAQDLVSDIKENLANNSYTFQHTMSQAIHDSLTKKIDICIIPGHAAHLSLVARTFERSLNIYNPLFPQAFGTFIPNRRNQIRLMLDLGAFINQDLFKLAVLAEGFLKYCYKLKNIKVGFLNIGSEETKGPSEIREAAAAYRKYNPEGFFGKTGFIEPDKIFGKGDCNAVICNALNGNLVLKASEGAFRSLLSLIVNASKESILKRILGFFTSYLIKGTLELFDPERYNYAIAFGFSNTITKIHGDSNERGIFYAIEGAASFHKYYGDFYSYFSSRTEELFKNRASDNLENQL